ncbi:PDZ domain-containing protein [Novipirellula sp.]|uniref:PDZ domain-containing protein n=1 Tax=Novipirellula sp. TaxID=2795430 RepID=UPI0035685283
MNCRTNTRFSASGVVVLMTLVTSSVILHAGVSAHGNEPLAAPLGEQADFQPQIGDWGEPFVEPQHPGRDHFGGWHLGVFGHYTTTGHLLTQVFPNTPASRAGLEPGDRIITVNGFQVGDVLDRQYPIDILIQRHASPNGFVRLLVQNRRTLRLHNLDVRLARGRIHF